MSDAPETPAELPANLKFLRLLVTVLTGAMILGVVVVISLLVIRLGASPVALPDQITLPDGAKATAYTRGGDWFAVVVTTESGENIMIYDLASGALRQTVALD